MQQTHNEQAMCRTILRAARREGAASLLASASKMAARGHAVVASDLRALALLVGAP